MARPGHCAGLASGMIAMALVGRTAPPFYFDVEPSKVREFARAVYDDHAGIGGPPVPPTFPMYGVADFERRFLFDLLGLNQTRTLNGGQRFDYQRPLQIGDRLRCETRVIDEYFKTGRRGGCLHFVIYEIEMRDDATKQLVVRSRSTVVETGAVPVDP